MNDAIMASITLCRKAGRLVMGFDPVKEACIKGSAKLVLIAQDISPKSKKEIVRVAQMYSVRCADIPHDMDTIKAQLGRRSGILAMTDSGFAEMILKRLPAFEQEEPVI